MVRVRVDSRPAIWKSIAMIEIAGAEIFDGGMGGLG